MRVFQVPLPFFAVKLFNDLHQSGKRVGILAKCGINIPYSSSSVEFLLIKLIRSSPSPPLPTIYIIKIVFIWLCNVILLHYYSLSLHKHPTQWVKKENVEHLEKVGECVFFLL